MAVRRIRMLPMIHTSSQRKGITLALLAALLFGVSTPLAKGLTPHVDALILAGLLYLGSGVGLGAYFMIRRWHQAGVNPQAPLSRSALPSLAGAFLAGGLIGPFLLMWGLGKTPASTASLLLNLEGVFTALVAWFAFREHFDKRIAWGMVLIVAGGLFLSWNGRPATGLPWGSLAIGGACLAWAVDNNLTRKISESDPIQIACIKGLIAGGVNTVLGLSLGGKLPEAPTLAAVGLIGLVGYGLSLTFFVVALRHLGTARTGAYFSVAPFAGASVSVLLLKEPITISLGLAALLMAWGVWLHLTERHEHLHLHDAMDHEHPHSHDEHHQHAHETGAPEGEPHTHLHHHSGILHSHPHYPDIHHRHRHSRPPRSEPDSRSNTGILKVSIGVGPCSKSSQHPPA